jgi:hypothetical protein
MAAEHRLRDHGLDAIAFHRLEQSGVDLLRPVEDPHHEVQPQLPGRLRHLADKDRRLRFGEPKKRYRPDIGLDVANKLEPLAGEVRRSQRQPGEIGVGTRERRHETDRQRIGDDHHDRNGRGRLLGKLGHRRDARDQHVDGPVDKLANDRLRMLAIAIGETSIEANIAAFGVAILRKTFAQIFQLVFGRLRLPGNEADLENPAQLRGRRERQCHCARKRAKKLPPPHSITSSQRAISDSGIVSPSAFAVLRLTTSSNLVGCSTGMSAGFAPRRILSTNSAARR